MVFYAALGDEENEVYVSPQIESLLGFTQQEWLTNPLLWYSQLHPDDHQEVIEAFTRGVQTGAPFRAQVRFFSRTGEEVWILGEARLIRDELGRPEYFQGVAFDITMTKIAGEAMAEAERAKVEVAQLRAEAFEAHNLALLQLNQDLRAAKEAAEAAARARTTFLTTMSHELRTPLNSVIVLAGLLADDEVTTAQRDMIRRMQLASSHLLELINDVLEFSRLRAGHVELDLRSFDLLGWVDDTLDIVGPRAAEKGLEMRVDIAEGVPRRLTADEGRLRQILLNLLANSVKFTAHGFVEVRIDALPLAAGRWEYECEVRDSGIGIRPEDAAMLFDEFRQADSGIAREFGGTGLGLAICRRLCELLGGRIWVQEIGGQKIGGQKGGQLPGEGRGATIVFTWVAEADGAVLTGAPGVGSRPDAPRRARPTAAATLAPSDVAPRHDTPAGSAAAPPRRRQLPPAIQDLRILIAEDNLMNQEVALLLLSAMGYHADVVATGDDAIAAVLAETYDVVLMDVAMPGTDGLAATRAIRHLGPHITQPYIVALTAHAFPGDAESCFEAGMDDYVAKPIDRAQLARALAAGGRRAGGGPAGNGLVAPDQNDPLATVGAAQIAPGPEAPGIPQATGGGSDGSDDFDPSLPMEILTQIRIGTLRAAGGHLPRRGRPVSAGGVSSRRRRAHRRRPDGRPPAQVERGQPGGPRTVRHLHPTGDPGPLEIAGRRRGTDGDHGRANNGGPPATRCHGIGRGGGLGRKRGPHGCSVGGPVAADRRKLSRSRQSRGPRHRESSAGGGGGDSAGWRVGRGAQLALGEGKRDRVDDVLDHLELGQVGEVGVYPQGMLGVEGQAHLGQVSLGDNPPGQRRRRRRGGGLIEDHQIAGDTAHHHDRGTVLAVAGPAPSQLAGRGGGGHHDGVQAGLRMEHHAGGRCLERCPALGVQGGEVVRAGAVGRELPIGAQYRIVGDISRHRRASYLVPAVGACTGVAQNRQSRALGGGPDDGGRLRPKGAEVKSDRTQHGAGTAGLDLDCGGGGRAGRCGGGHGGSAHRCCGVDRRLRGRPAAARHDEGERCSHRRDECLAPSHAQPDHDVHANRWGATPTEVASRCQVSIPSAFPRRLGLAQVLPLRHHL